MKATRKKKQARLHKGPGRLLPRTTMREWTLMLYAAAVTNARDCLIRAKYEYSDPLRAHHLQGARHWGAEARKHFVVAMGQGRRAA